MSLEKLTITPLKDKGKGKGKPFKVLFNPTSYSISKTVNWVSPLPAKKGEKEPEQSDTNKSLNAPILNFGGGGSRSLTLELFFDVTEQVEVEGNTITISDVRTLTDRLVKLSRIDRDLKRPPKCEISWGKSKGIDFPFVGVVTSLTQNFTLFDSSGVPLRARLTVTFTEVEDWNKDQREIDPDFTTRVVKLGDSLSGIASELYANPELWRVIAEANHLDDPRHLNTGVTLHIPKID